MKSKHVKRVRSRGRIYFYHSVTGKRLSDDPLEAAEQARAITATLPKGSRKRGKTGENERSIGALIAAYKGSVDFKKKKERTRKDYTRHMDELAAKFGKYDVAELDAEVVLDIRDLYAEHPRKADYMVQVLSILCGYAVKRPRRFGLKANPCLRLGKLYESDGYPPWPDNVIQRALEAAYPELRQALLMALYLGQRGQDDVVLTWNQYDGRGFELGQLKTGADLYVPAHPNLRTMLDRMSRRAVVVLTTKTGRPWKLDHLRHEITELVTGIGFPGYSRHGLQKNAINNLFEVGCTSQQVRAVTGKSLQMIEHYAKAVDQRRLAQSAIDKLIENELRSWTAD